MKIREPLLRFSIFAANLYINCILRNTQGIKTVEGSAESVREAGYN